MVFFKIEVNACILIHPISTCNFLGNILKISKNFSLKIPQVTSFDFTQCFFLGAIFFFRIACQPTISGQPKEEEKNELFSFILEIRLQFK